MTSMIPIMVAGVRRNLQTRHPVDANGLVPHEQFASDQIHAPDGVDPSVPMICIGSRSPCSRGLARSARFDGDIGAMRSGSSHLEYGSAPTMSAVVSTWRPSGWFITSSRIYGRQREE